MSSNKSPSPPSSPFASPAPPNLTAQEATELARIVLDAMAIQRHYHLFLWLHGSLRAFLPHQVLLSAYGDFSTWDLRLDFVSALPSVNTRELAHDNIDGLIQLAHTQWIEGDRRPISLSSTVLRTTLPDDASPLHGALRGMTSTFVHGVHDYREGRDSLYIVQDRSVLGNAASARFLAFLDLLIPQIDVAFRRVAALPIGIRHGKGPNSEDASNLSRREQEILDLICHGATNADIATELRISPFTVKNHLQRIFKKIGVSNRTQAATRYSEALKELRKLLT